MSGAHGALERVRRALTRLEGSSFFICLVPSRGAALAASDEITRLCSAVGRPVVAWSAPSESGRPDASVYLVDGPTEARRDQQLSEINSGRDAQRFAKRAGFVVVLHDERARFAQRAPDVWSARAEVFTWSHLKPGFEPLSAPLVRGDRVVEPPTALLRHCSTLSLAGLAAQDEAGGVPRLSLQDLVQDLRVVGPLYPASDGRLLRLREEGSAGILRYPVSILQGEAGSGKTTQLKRLAISLARAGQAVVFVALPELDVRVLEGLDLPRALQALCAACPWEPRADARPWLLLDGLDELVDRDRRARISLLADDLVLAGLASGAVLASRPDAPETASSFSSDEFDLENAALPDVCVSMQDLPRLAILPLGDDEVRSYVERWVELTVSDVRERARNLERVTQAVQYSGTGGGQVSVSALCRRPLFLAAVCALAWSRGGEVEGGAELLLAFVRALIYRRKQARTGGRGPEDLRELALELAWVLHERRAISATQVELASLSPLLGPSAIDALLLGTGLLTGDRTRGVRFVHVAFQEVLVAEQLADRVGWDASDDLRRALWLMLAGPMSAGPVPLIPQLFLEMEGHRSTVRLARFLESCLTLEEPSDSAALKLDRQRLRWVALMAEVWGASPPLRLRALHERARAAVVQMNREMATQPLPGLGGRTARLASQLGDRTLGEPRFVPVLEGWELAVWPVTNWLFGEFVADGGYETRRWWDPAGWTWRQTPASSRSKEHPDRWGDPGFDEPAAPVCGLSVHEARAFARWFADRYESRASLPPIRVWRTAAENSQLWDRSGPSGRWQSGPSLVAAAAQRASHQGVEDLGGLVRQYLEGPGGIEWYGGYAWCDEPRPLSETLAQRQGGGRRWYHPFGVRLALRPA